MTYLSKDGKVSGPYEDDKIAQMKASGDFYQFEWMWDGHSPDWSPVPRKMQGPPPLPAAPPVDRPIETAAKTGTLDTTKIHAARPATPAQPAPAVTKTNTKTPKPPVAGTAKAKPAAEPVTSSKVFPAIVFDNRQSIGGEVTQAHAGGGKFVSTPHAASHFPKGAQVFVDVLDEQKDKSAKVKGTISTISREENRWVFELEWQGLPLL